MKKSFILTGTILSSLFVSTSAFASTTYEVKPGDSLYQISKNYNTSVQELKNLNKLTTNIIVPGQVIKVDDKEETYVVKAGDSLGQIAKSFETSIEELVKLNPEISNPNLIVVGQTIRVSGQAPESVYTVQLGDTLSKIAKAHNTTVDFLMSLNTEITNANNIRVGQSVKVAGVVVDVTKATTTTPSQTEVKTEEPKTEVSTPEPVKEQPKTEVSTPEPVKEQPKTEVSTPEPVKEQPKAEAPAPKPAPTPAPKPETTPEPKPTPAPDVNKASGNSVISAGSKYMGARYVYGASTSRTDAFDCSSFTLRAFKEGAGISLPRTSSAQSTVGTPVSINSLQKGDLIFFDTDYNGSINHVGIYAGNGQMLNAATSKGVSYASINSSYWKPRIVKAVRVL